MYIPSGSELLNPHFLLEKSGIREGWKVADFGSGSAGHFVFPAARMVGASGTSYAVDILKPALSGIVSREKLEGVKNVKRIWADLDVPGATKIVDDSLDLVLLINNRVHESMIREAVRVLKPGGRLLIVDWKIIATPFGPPTAERVSVEGAKERVEKYGLQVVEEFEAGKYHWGLLLRK